MLLFIDSSNHEQVRIALVEKNRIVEHKFEPHNLSEILTLEIKSFFKKQKVSFKQLKQIAIISGPGGFSKIRTGIATANALGFSLKIPLIDLKASDLPKDLTKLLSLRGQKMVAPHYDREPNITLSKK